jgi:Pregnancy-associated plasma protein-A
VSTRALVGVALAALALALLIVLLDVPHLSWPVSPSPSPSPSPSQWIAAAPPPSLPSPVAGCVPHLARVCWGGDAWWQDGCGRREELAQRCDETACAGGECQPPPSGPPCEKLSEGGRCDGNVLRWCDRGIARAVDCAASGRRCGMPLGEPRCYKPEPCAEDECYKRFAQVCVDGDSRYAWCAGGCELDENHHARCVRRANVEDGCHGCNCPSPTPLPSPLPPLPVVVFLVAGADGNPADSEERARLSVARAAALLAQPEHDTGIRLALTEVRTLVRPGWLSADARSIYEMDDDPELHPADRFFVPIVFVRDLRLGDITALGVGTFPKGTCGGIAMFPYVGDGVVVLARLRYRTTLAHELGHYLGLCHTHQPDPPLPTRILSDGDGTPVECAACTRSGDGVCDTPIDPGVEDEGCTLDVNACTVRCANGAAPDPNNLMSYFVPCRRWFSDEQAAWMRRWAWWRLHRP